MKKLVLLLSLCLVIPVMAVGPNGEIDTAGGDPAIVINDDWYATTDVPPAFFWGGELPVFSSDGPFTFTNAFEARIDVTDDFLKGDIFTIYDWGVPIGTTSIVAVDDDPALNVGVGPEAAFNDPTYSSGSFIVGPGAHSIEIEVISGFTGGRGYIRATIRPRSPGYWKNHPEAWPVDEIEIGGVIITKDDAIALMMMPTKGDKTLTLFPALVAAKLNIMVDAFPFPCIEDTIIAADEWMADNPPLSGVKGKDEAWEEGEPLYDMLDEYINDILVCD